MNELTVRETSDRIPRKWRTSLITIAFFGVLLRPASAAEIHVPADYATIQGAIRAATDDDEIIVAPGVYNEAINLSDKAIAVRSSHGRTLTTIDAEGQSASVVTIVSDDGVASVLAGFTLKNGIGNFHGDVRYGGGLDLRGGSLEVSDCVIDSNSAWGGGIYAEDAILQVRNCIIQNNVSVDGGVNGGGAYIVRCSPLFYACQFVKNVGEQGAGVYSVDGRPAIVDCTFRSNYAGEHGGGVRIERGSAAIIGCVFLQNWTLEAGGGVSGWDLLVLNSSFFGNKAGLGGGGISAGQSTIENCTFLGNIAGSLGRYEFRGAINADATTTIKNCIIWSNGQDAIWNHNPEEHPAVQFSDVQGGWTGLANIDTDPLLTPDGHLRHRSPCIDAGANGTDMGADEFEDSDGDHLPDWWELKYFDSEEAADAAADSDGDGLSNLEEYEELSSNPTASPFYVDWHEGADSNDGRQPASDGQGHGPKKTIQAALTLASAGDTVLVISRGDVTYAGEGNFDLDFDGKSVVVRKCDVPGVCDEFGVASIDCGGAARAINSASIRGTHATLEGFTITNGEADLGGALNMHQSLFILKDCVVESNRATTGGGGIFSAWGAPRIDSLTIGQNYSPEDGEGFSSNGGLFWDSTVNLVGDLKLNAGMLESRSSWFHGAGKIDLTDDTLLHITGEDPGSPPSVIRSSIGGKGDIHIDAGQVLRIEDERIEGREPVIVDLSGFEGKGCADPDESKQWGKITVDGALVVKNAILQNTNVDVTLENFEGQFEIFNNNIRLLQGLGLGGQFFAEDGAGIRCNTIVSDGDRYFDLDPDPTAVERPIFEDNRITVLIGQGLGLSQGELLELRSLDRHCDTEHNPNCDSGAFAIPSIPDDDDWVLERLEILAGAKVNLTNREGFCFQDNEQSCEDPPEALYVKELVFHPDGVLNTALQTIYYETLIKLDENGEPVEENGSRIIDIPMLGFSLKTIHFDDEEEFSIRVRKRTSDPDDPPLENRYDLPFEGSIELAPDPDSGRSVMDMRTLREGDYRTTISVAAKGAFARAGDETIKVAFTYRFLENPDAELIVYLSDGRVVSEDLIEIARIRPPAPGRPGSIGSTRYATFIGSFHAADLNFRRGTYIELELRDPDRDRPSRIYIDDWDPHTVCVTGGHCGDFNNDRGTSATDFLYALGEFGQLSGPTKWCADNQLNLDYFLDFGDLLSWDAYQDRDGLNQCGGGGPDLPRGSGGPVALIPSAFVIGGKQKGRSAEGEGVQEDFLYNLDPRYITIDEQGTTHVGEGACPGDARMEPASGTGDHGHRANGRFVADAAGRVHQIHAHQGLVRLEDAQTVLPPGILSADEGEVHVGMQVNEDGKPLGVPILDVSFHATDPDILYVTPVLVTATVDGEECSYRTTAKLRLTAQGDPPYQLEALYGVLRDGGGCNNSHPCDFSECDEHRVRQIAVDPISGHLLVISAKARVMGDSTNDWLLVFDEASGEKLIDPVDLHDMFTGPTALTVSSDGAYVYLASSVNDLDAGSTLVYEFGIERNGEQISGFSGSRIIEITGMRHVTAINEHPTDGTMWVTGFMSPNMDDETTFWLDCDRCDQDPNCVSCEIFTTPVVAIVPAERDSVTAGVIRCFDMALPLTAIFSASTGCVRDPAWQCDGDVDGDGQVNPVDSGLVQAAFGSADDQDLCNYDLDCDGQINPVDSGIVQSLFGTCQQPRSVCP